MKHGDLHSALKTAVLADISEGGISYKHVRLQHGKNEFTDTLHARPTSFSPAGLQATDFLHFLGFSRSACAFQGGECYCRAIEPDHDAFALAAAIGRAFERFDRGAGTLGNCGLFIDQPEGWGFFYGKPSSERTFATHRSYGNGHIAPKSERLKESEDAFFRFVFTWIDGAGDKGWTTHYRAKHMPLSIEFQAALGFLGGFSWFGECPEFNFDGCWWRFMPYREDDDRAFNRNTETVHRFFDAHANHFSPGLEQLLAAHAELEPHRISFLSIQPTTAPITPSFTGRRAIGPAEVPRLSVDVPQRFDVAISFAGPERQLAESLAKSVRDAGYVVFYDGFYPEQLWGKDLVSFFDRVYRKASRFCVMFVSREYSERMWTTFERRSAQARALEEKGREYILPIRIDNTDLDGLPPTIGYISVEEHSIEKIASLLIRKLSIMT